MKTEEKTTSDYWDKRADREYCYKNEKFYTITPIPYYYQRRKLILKRIKNILMQKQYKRICDFGCGDGEYIVQLNRNGKSFYGVDASENMIELAKKRTADMPNVQFEVSEVGIGEKELFDLVYSSAVWAHINEEAVKGLYANIYEHLNENGVFIICEQVAPYYYEGKNYIRRTSEQYIDLLEKAGFSVVNIETIDFWLHRILFEKHLVKKICARKKYVDRSQEEVKIQLNKNSAYRLVSLILTKLSIPNIFEVRSKGKIKNRWGYSFVVAVKSGTRV